MDDKEYARLRALHEAEQHPARKLPSRGYSRKASKGLALANGVNQNTIKGRNKPKKRKKPKKQSLFGGEY